MKKIDWARKLTSRKFWVAVVGLVTSTLLVFGVAESEATQIAGIIMQAATVVGYIIGEGLADSNSGILVEDTIEVKGKEE